MIRECSAAAIVESTACHRAPGNSSWNARWSAGDLASVTRSAVLTHASSMRVVRCRASSARTAGRDSCSAAMALGAAQQHERGTHADERERVRELEHAYAVKCGVLAEAVPREHRGDNSPRGPHGGERGLQREELERGGDFGGDEAGVCEAYVDGGGEGGGEGAGRLGPRS